MPYEKGGLSKIGKRGSLFGYGGGGGRIKWPVKLLGITIEGGEGVNRTYIEIRGKGNGFRETEGGGGGGV